MSKASTRAVNAGFAGQGVGIIDIALWEIAMLAHKKRVVFTKDVQEWLQDLALLPHFRCLPVSASIAVLSTRLPGRFHKDPVDRLLVAASIDLGAPWLPRMTASSAIHTSRPSGSLSQKWHFKGRDLHRHQRLFPAPDGHL